MKLSIQSYEMLDFDSCQLLVSRKGVTKIKSKPLSVALSKLQRYTNISKGELNSILSEHGLNQEVAYEFLETALDIKENLDGLYFDRTIVAHDWTVDSGLESLLRSEINTPLEVVNISDLISRIGSGEKVFVAIVCNGYDYGKLKKMYFDISRAMPESAISVGYRAGGTFCISQPYLPKIGNPCHFCAVDRLINYEGFQKSKNHWSKLLRFCREQHASVPASSMSVFQRSLIVGALIKKIKLLSGLSSECRYQDNILQETQIDLSNFFVREVSVAHWHMCDCLGVQA